jgi:glutamate synthase domain-containing protein 3
VGVAKAHADVILVSGNAGGTGASSLVSIKHAGSPWEIGVAEAHQALAANGLRTSVTLETDGGLRTGRDVIVAALLGADRFGFGTLPLLALGCKMVRQCHENTCPVGITTQREDLRAKFTGSVDQVIRLFTLLATDVQRQLARMGAASIEEIVGRGDLLVPHDQDDSVGASFSRLLVDARPDTERSFRTIPRSPLGDVLADQAPIAGSGNDRIDLRYPIRNRDRAVGTRLSGLIARTWGDAAPDGDAVSIGLIGSAGQSLGAFLTGGVSIDVDGTGNDGVGKGMGGGVVVIRPSVSGEGVPHGAGNACLYGATGGGLFISGAVGQRFAVRNSGARAVVEGASDHCCEYMTGGTVVVLGSVGGNVAAGMTGGVLFIWDPDLTAKARFSDTAPPASRLSDADAHLLHDLVVEHYERTDSSNASELLASWSAARDQFWVLRPLPPRAVGAAVESESASSV